MVDLEAAHCEAPEHQAEEQEGNNHHMVTPRKLYTDHDDPGNGQTWRNTVYIHDK